jgi:hypothetical protein
MVPSNIIQRIFYIKYINYLGTGFTFERDNKQFLITARHIFPFSEYGQDVKFSIMHNNNWKELDSKIFIHNNPSVDIVALQLPHDISPRNKIDYGQSHFFLSQDAFFLGFPLGNYMEDVKYINNGYPVPFIKKAIFATIPIEKSEVKLFYLDGINNPGFSGGPCVFVEGHKKTPNVCGVVKGYLPHKVNIKTHFGDYPFEENSGLVEVHSIQHLFEMQF